MSDIRSIIERALRGGITRPIVTTSVAELNDPTRRRNFSQLLGVTAVTPEEPQKTGSDPQTPTPAAGTDQAGGGSE